MKKSDLKLGMILELRSGDKFFLIEVNEEMFGLSFDGCYLDLNCIDEFLFCTFPQMEEVDVVKIYSTKIRPFEAMFNSDNLTLLWEREEIDWLKIKTDTKFLVKNAWHKEFSRRYFSHLKNEIPYFFIDGQDSFTTNGETESFYEVKLFKSEE